MPSHIVFTLHDFALFMVHILLLKVWNLGLNQHRSYVSFKIEIGAGGLLDANSEGPAPGQP